MVLDTACTRQHQSELPYDLVHVIISRIGSSYEFVASYTGQANRHDILVTFDLGASALQVTGELFEGGQGVARLLDQQRGESTFLDPPQVVTSGRTDLVVRGDQLRDIAALPSGVQVSLRVDGAYIESCP